MEVPSIICPDQLPVRDPWKALGGTAGVLAVAVDGEVSVICPDQLPVSDPWKVLGGATGSLLGGIVVGVGEGGREEVVDVEVAVVEDTIEAVIRVVV